MTASSAATLLELGARYAALGLPSAARGAFERAARVASEDDAAPARNLAELAMVSGNARLARVHAETVVRREPGAEARLLLGRTQLSDRAYDAARLSFNAVLESVGPERALRARAHLGLSEGAAAVGDRRGAGANAMAALDELVELAAIPDGGPKLDARLALVEDAVGRAVAHGRASDVMDVVETFAAREPSGPAELLRAVSLAARQSHGEAEITDADVEAALERELETRSSRVARMLLIQRRLRRRQRDASARSMAVQELESLAIEITEDEDPGSSFELARVYTMLASAYEDDPASATLAEAAYRNVLSLRPGNAAAANRLSQLALSRGDHEAAITEIERALRIDPNQGLAWRNAARVVAVTKAGPEVPKILERLFDAATPGSGTTVAHSVPRLALAIAEVARADVLHGMHTQGHRMKNLLGIIGSRTRSARKRAEGELAERLQALEDEVTNLYDEWAAYLRSMQSPITSVIEVVPVAPLVTEVVAAAAEQTATVVNMSIDDGIPDLRGDRMLLREALLNLVNNAAEACADGDGQVEVTARCVRSAGKTVVEIEVVDTGPGIPRADLSRVFVPGFTTKVSGSGVGLAIVEQVVTAHHGRILIDSEVGQGTRITLMLPCDLGGFSGLASIVTDQRRGEVE